MFNMRSAAVCVLAVMMITLGLAHAKPGSIKNTTLFRSSVSDAQFSQVGITTKSGEPTSMPVFLAATSFGRNMFKGFSADGAPLYSGDMPSRYSPSMDGAGIAYARGLDSTITQSVRSVFVQRNRTTAVCACGGVGLDGVIAWSMEIKGCLAPPTFSTATGAQLSVWDNQTYALSDNGAVFVWSLLVSASGTGNARTATASSSCLLLGVNAQTGAVLFKGTLDALYSAAPQYPAVVGVDAEAHRVIAATDSQVAVLDTAKTPWENCPGTPLPLSVSVARGSAGVNGSQLSTRPSAHICPKGVFVAVASNAGPNGAEVRLYKNGDKGYQQVHTFSPAASAGKYNRSSSTTQRRSHDIATPSMALRITTTVNHGGGDPDGCLIAVVWGGVAADGTLSTQLSVFSMLRTYDLYYTQTQSFPQAGQGGARLDAGLSMQFGYVLASTAVVTPVGSAGGSDRAVVQLYGLARHGLTDQNPPMFSLDSTPLTGAVQSAEFFVLEATQSHPDVLYVVHSLGHSVTAHAVENSSN